jgi:hypothetical protein
VENHLDHSELTNIIIDSAKISIGKTSGKIHRLPVPWWSDEIRRLIRERRKAEKNVSV